VGVKAEMMLPTASTNARKLGEEDSLKFVWSCPATLVSRDEAKTSR
jgi:hypothetical protein